MNSRQLSVALHVVVAIGVVSCSAPGPDPAPAPASGSEIGVASEGLILGSPASIFDVCPTIAGEMRCHAKIVTRPHGSGVTPFVTPSGWGPPDLASAYNYGSLAAPAPTPIIGIIDAFNDPNAEADLAVYRSNYGLSACTSANGCFTKVDENGGTSYPVTNANWAAEISLDLDMASAACPSCKLILVEATTAQLTDLGKGVNTAVSLGATVISNSYGGAEISADSIYDAAYFAHLGVTIFASTGDKNYQAGTQYPASSAWVIGVGGTSLVKTGTGRGWSESVWNDDTTDGAGSGCSAFTPTPVWQGTSNGEPSGCAKKVTGDLSAVADPNTGLAVYDTVSQPGWIEVGGTSASCPLVAGIFARAGLAGVSAGYVWDQHADFYDVTTGNNGSCSGSFLCTAKVGFDAPTGWGTPNGALLGAAVPLSPPWPTHVRTVARSWMGVVE